MILPDNPQERADEVMVLVKIISRRSWVDLQAMHRACPGSTVDHLYRGMHVLTIPTGGATEVAA